MPHSASHIAQALIEKSGGLDPMKLLKLTYLCQGWMLGLYGQPLIWDDVEAWRYGPVFRDIYRVVSGHQTVRDLNVQAPRLTTREQHLIDQVWEKYGHMTGLQLSALTHQKDSPWDLTYRRFGQNAVIPKSLIREYYEGLAAR